MRPFLLLLTAVVSVGSAQPTPDVARAETERVFSGLGPAVHILGQDYPRYNIDARMREYNIPGVAVALIENDEVRWVRTFGVKENPGHSPIDESTRFMVKSLSKPVTAFGALLLAQEGMLSLDEPANEYLTRWRIPQNELTAQRQPTLRLILTHQAGFTVWGVPSYKEGEPLPTLLEALRGEPPAKPDPVFVDYLPGTRTRYSGGGFSVLQLMIEEATGRAFPDAMRSLVLDSLNMDHSLFYPGVPQELKATTAVGHGNDGQPIEGRWERIVQMAAGGLLSTSEDIARFVIALNQAWQGESVLLSPELASEMLSANADGWGLGLEVFGNGARLEFRHSGGGDGFRAILVGFPAIRKGAVVLTNSDAGSELRYEILRSLSNEYVWPSFRVLQRPVAPVEPARLRSFVGRYEYSNGSATVVRQDSVGLVAQWRDERAARIYPANDTLFFSLANEEFVFTSWNEGLPSALIWSGTFGSYKADRTP